MKKILLFSLLIISQLLFSQIENFTLSNNQVKWNKVYESSKTLQDVKNEIGGRNNLKIIEENENSIIGEFSNLTMDYKKAGFTYMGTPIVLNETNKFSGSFKIEFKENRYRATIWNLNSKGMNMTLYGGGLGLGSELSTNLEELLLKKGNTEFRKNAYKVVGKIIDTTFQNLMDFTMTSSTNNEW